jgi:hypothetical protein
MGSFVGCEMADCEADHSCLSVFKLQKDVAWVVGDHGF